MKQQRRRHKKTGQHHGIVYYLDVVLPSIFCSAAIILACLLIVMYV